MIGCALIKGLAIIAGVGPGLGSSLSRRFAKEYTVVCLARSQGTLKTVSDSIKNQGGEVILSPTVLISVNWPSHGLSR